MTDLDDPYHGVGGCYEVDPQTGKRIRVSGRDPAYATPGDPLPSNECHSETAAPTQD